MSGTEKDFLKEAVREFYEKWKAQGGEYEFYEVAVGCFYGKGMTRQKALIEARRLYPPLYKEFLYRTTSGGKSQLPLAFEKFKEMHDQARAEAGKMN